MSVMNHKKEGGREKEKSGRRTEWHKMVVVWRKEEEAGAKVLSTCPEEYSHSAWGRRRLTQRLA